MNMHPHRSRLLAIAMLALLPSLALASAGASAVPGALVRAAQKPNSSGVQVSYRLEGEAAAGRPVRITVVLGGVTDGAGATVRFGADPGLKLDGAPAAATPLAAGQATTFSLTVVPQADGLRYLNVFTTQNGVTSATSIPVQAGDAGPAARAPGKLKDTPKGDKILSMPVK